MDQLTTRRKLNAISAPYVNVKVALKAARMTNEMITAMTPIVRNCLLRYAFAPSMIAFHIAIIFSFPVGYFLTDRTRIIEAMTPMTASEVVSRRGSNAKFWFLLLSNYGISVNPPDPDYKSIH